MSKARVWFNGIVGAIFLGAITFGIVYRLGHPWNCEQANEALREAEYAEKEAFNEMKKAGSQLNGDAYKVAIQKKLDAEVKEIEKCQK
ncbi:MAG TPA: hypothetical protein IGS53_11360 [Leptolyngbyaceae cyanobacterium M33_DOE_097]|uniref:Uncharacterized protein n=1 Tax=Oscillatoriales cyanobacterium SpSt-418 TaxID=2282169 RepID=A0A7C3PEP0_9CYAN|nr:hypothetical protein [Leptolyngbyaceae cyanobacterium M33_DOE_097]